MSRLIRVGAQTLFDDAVRPVPVLVTPASAGADSQTGSAVAADQPGTERLSADEAAVRRRCVEMLAEASRQAEAILETARQEAERLRESARAQGFDLGFEAGRAEALERAHSECERIVAETAERLRQADQYRRDLVTSAADTIAATVMEATRQLLARELVLAPADVGAMVSELLQYAIDSSRVEVHVHPSDFLAATEAHPKWKDAKFGEWEIVVIPDTSIAPGGCEVRSEYGRVDARVETKLELLASAVAAVVERSVRDCAGELAGVSQS
ncbi:MAG: hypothetical protein IRZ33_02405 [Alicyclobacillaceae bacterium]|nr:hypothetical protein [Alicyclobacillaceae bacterium]